jgi:hypothetical protein
VSELSESKTREYEETLMEKDEEIDGLKRENQGLNMIQRAAKKIKAKPEYYLLHKSGKPL